MKIGKIKWRTLIICIAIPLLVGIVSGLISRSGMDTFDSITKPLLSPPAWLFPVVWTILYTLMGIASYLVVVSGSSRADIEQALMPYGLQLFFNFFWSIIFFNFKLYTFAFVWLLALWILIIITAVRFYRISKSAAYLIIPYLIWVTFAAYLNLAIAILN